MANVALAEPDAPAPPTIGFAPDAESPRPAVDDAAARPPIGVVRSALVMVAALCLGFVGYVTVGSALQHHAAQNARYERLRGQLALGTAPVGPKDDKGRLLPMSAPIAVLRIPSLGLREVVGEGTTGAALRLGPGHLRSSVFPGGAGTSVVLGRAHTYGGPFGDVEHLRRGATIVTVTANGTETFRVVDVRRSGQPIPALAPGAARLTLVTATGSAYLPSQTVSVDADATEPLPSDPPPFASVPAAERPLGTSTAGMWMLFVWLEALVLLSIGAVWTWFRRSPAHAWLLFTAPVLFVATAVCRTVIPLLPNLM